MNGTKDQEPQQRTNFLLGPKKSLPTRDELLGVPYEPPMIVANYLQEDGGGVVGAGETGKSTVMLYEGVHIILSRPLYGRRIVRSGGVLYLTAEDSRDIVMSRLNWICRALNLKPKEQAQILKQFHVEDVSASPAKLVELDRDGIHRTAFVDEITNKYKDSKLAVVVVDPTSLLGPGELSGNDGMAELMRTARMLGQSLKAATRVVHHVSQNVARSGINDQYAGRGGTAFADNSRSQHQIRRLTDRKLEHEGSTYILPASVSDEALAGAPGLRVLAIFTHKLSYSQRDSTPIILIRRGFAFEHVPIERLDKSPLADAERRDHDRFKVLDFIGERLGVGIKLTKDELDRHGGTLGMTRQELRDARDSLLTMKLLNLKALPKDEQRTKRKTYLAPGGQPNPANPAEFRRNPAGGITKQGGTAAANPAADGTSIRRRDLKPKKPAKHRNDKEAVFGRIPPSVTGKKRMNGKAAYHA